VTTIKHIVLGIGVIGLSGCATFNALEADIPLFERTYIYCGTRLDWATLTKDDITVRKFKADPPSYPLIDLPFSFALDSLFLPLAVSAEIFH